MLRMKNCQQDKEECAAHAQVRAIVEASNTSFFWAMRLLPKDKRDSMFAVYAFCRVVDDIADGPIESTHKKQLLEKWRAKIIRLFKSSENNPTSFVDDPITVALKRSIACYELRQVDFLALIDGMEMDAQPVLRLQNWDELMLYCERVACAVGRLSNRVFGIDDMQGDPLAKHLGTALQLTNILRDLVEDAERNRLYLPADLLATAGISENAPHQILAHPNLNKVCNELAHKAATHFQAADTALALCNPNIMKPILIIRGVYYQILKRIIKRGWTTLTPRITLSKSEKLWIVLRYGLRL